MNWKKTRSDIAIEAVQRTLEMQRSSLLKKDELIDTQRRELNGFRTKALPSFVAKILNPWLESWKPPTEARAFCDPVLGSIHGQISFDKELASLIMHPIVQRLNYIRQLSFSFFEFPTANHSRITHLFGTAYNMESALRKVFHRNEIFPTRESIQLSSSEKEGLVTIGKIGALLHDIGHGPFGHALDKYLSVDEEFLQRVEYVELQDKPDKFLSLQYIDKYLKPTLEELGARLGFDPDLIPRLLDQTKKRREEADHLAGFHRFIGDLIDSALDTDRMDYLVRDAYFTGLSSGTLNTAKLLSALIPFKMDDQIQAIFHPSGIACIEQLLYARFSMYVNCYEKPKKLAAEAMLSRAIDDFLHEVGRDAKITINDLMLLSDEGLMNLILALSDESMTCFRLMSDLARGHIYDEVETSIKLPPLGQDASLNPELMHFYQGLILEGTERATVYTTSVNEWAARLRSGTSAQKEPWKLLIVAPAYEAFDPRDKAVVLLSEDGKSTTSLGEQYPRLKQALTAWTAERLKVRIFASGEIGDDERQKIRSKAKEIWSLKEAK